jgi:hypothetical protein
MAAGGVGDGDDPAVVADHRIDAEPGRDDSKIPFAAEMPRQPSPGGLVEDEPIGAVAAHAGAAGLQQVDDKGWDTALLQSRFGVGCGGDRHGNGSVRMKRAQLSVPSNGCLRGECAPLLKRAELFKKKFARKNSPEKFASRSKPARLPFKERIGGAEPRFDRRSTIQEN